MRFPWFCLAAALGSLSCAHGAEVAPSASQFTPNLANALDRPLRYRPDGADFVIENGAEFFNRSLYGGNTAFRVDGGDKPEFVLYLPGRGGNVRLGIRSGRAVKWLHDAAQLESRYRPGELLYRIRDPLLGPAGELTVEAVAAADTHALILKVQLKGSDSAAPVELVWAFGGVNGQRGKRDGDIGTEAVPISEWFQLQPQFCRGNSITLHADGFSVKGKPGTIRHVTSLPAKFSIASAPLWRNLPALLASRETATPPEPIACASAALSDSAPLYLAFQQLPDSRGGDDDLDTYREVSKERPSGKPKTSAPPPLPLSSAFAAAELAPRFEAARAHFQTLRQQVRIETPDAFLNAAAGALSVAADAAWDEPQQAIMHGAIAWRTKLLGWRGPYALDALGWHERARKHIRYWASRQNTDPIPTTIPPADEDANLARNEKGLHSNGDVSNTHYDMNLVFVDALFRHLRWTGDLELAREVWPVIERHLAWERRLFRREYAVRGDKLPLYEAYAAIWASDNLQYSGGGAAHASAYNYFHQVEAARLARALGQDPTPYETEAKLIARGMRELLWLPQEGWFAEYKDWLGLQRVHPSAGVWTFYHTMDSQVPTPSEAWQMSEQVLHEIPQLPVRGPGVPEGLFTVSTTNWMPYQWSINNVVMSEAMHTALGLWQAQRPEEAWKLAKGSLLAAMYMGISPGNVGSMSYLDVYRRESQRDFADGSGTLSRALVEGLFGIRPDALAGELLVQPGYPVEWDHAAIAHPDVAFRFTREATDHYTVQQQFKSPLSLRLRVPAPRDSVAGVRVNGKDAAWLPVESAIGRPWIEITAPAASRQEIEITWAGEAIRYAHAAAGTTGIVAERKTQGQMSWSELKPRSDKGETRAEALVYPTFRYDQASTFEPVDLTNAFNDRVTQIFKNEYRSPRSPFVSLALPKQGLGGWAGGVNATAEIDDRGLRELSRQHGGLLRLPSGVPLKTPGEPSAKNVVFLSLWDNYPPSATIDLSGSARGLVLLMAGSTGPMQSRFENGEIIATYADGTTDRLALVNPANWWPIEQDYLIDDYQFRRAGPLPTRVDLKTGRIRVLDEKAFKGRGGPVRGGAATVIEFPLNPARPLKSLSIRATANDVVIGLMAATLVR